MAGIFNPVYGLKAVADPPDEFLRLLRDWEASGNAQMIISTHSPIITSYPGATNLSFDCDDIEPGGYEKTEHYRVTKTFLGNPERYRAELFDDEPES